MPGYKVLYNATLEFKASQGYNWSAALYHVCMFTH